MKKKTLLLIILGACMCFAPTVLAKDPATTITGCSSVEALKNVVIDPKIPNAVHTIITAIKIIVPVVLVIFGMLDLFKGITAQKEDEIKKGQQILIKRLITAALVFFVISIVQVIMSVVAGASYKEGLSDCISCFLNGADEETGKCN